jgi:hypothetical protein
MKYMVVIFMMFLVACGLKTADPDTMNLVTVLAIGFVICTMAYLNWSSMEITKRKYDKSR